MYHYPENPFLDLKLQSADSRPVVAMAHAHSVPEPLWYWAPGPLDMEADSRIPPKHSTLPPAGGRLICRSDCPLVLVPMPGLPGLPTEAKPGALGLQWQVTEPVLVKGKLT